MERKHRGLPAAEWRPMGLKRWISHGLCAKAIRVSHGDLLICHKHGRASPRHKGFRSVTRTGCLLIQSRISNSSTYQCAVRYSNMALFAGGHSKWAVTKNTSAGQCTRLIPLKMGIIEPATLDFRPVVERTLPNCNATCICGHSCGTLTKPQPMILQEFCVYCVVI